LDGRALDVKEGCGTGECGSCSVLVDGVQKLSCLMLAAQLQGRSVVTAAGLGTPEAPHPVQRAFAEHGAVQCGFCTPGMAIAAAGLLAKNPAPEREDIRRALSGNLCRCTGYVKIVDAVEAAAKDMAGRKQADQQISQHIDRQNGQQTGQRASRQIGQQIGRQISQQAKQPIGQQTGQRPGQQADQQARQQAGRQAGTGDAK